MKTGCSIKINERSGAFTLLEVLIAAGLFFMATFAVLALVAQNLRTARMLQNSGPSFGMVAAELSLTNQIEEGSESGDFGDLYPEASWVRDVHLVNTNGLYQVDIVVVEQRGSQVVTNGGSIWLYRPGRGAAAPGRRP